ncbi:phosphotransferase [Nesterenkonia sp.]|uniref:phosphotransferase n=1 Tax=Nesterenkonia sp. TaxID=704201 RepID=UPI002623FA25|nr:phosphotransferase [Nesterenkonia sp.]
MSITTIPSAAAADALAAESAGLPFAHEVLDPDALSELLQRPVRITHLRIKPGHSVVAAHTDQSGRAGWTMLTNDPDKYGKALKRAADHALDILVHRTEPGMLYSGDVWADTDLAKELAAAREATGEQAQWSILRFNPRRRVVACVQGAGSPKVVRVLSDSTAALLSIAARWRHLGIPVTNAKALGRRGTAVSTPLWGTGDLAAVPHPPAAVTAGAALARLHAAEAPAELRRTPADPGPAAAGVARVAPWAAQHAEELAARLAERLTPLEQLPAAEVHGDLSPDQVILAAEGSHKIRLIDIDRAGAGRPMRDVGSWAAACRRDQQPELLEAFLAGYAEHAQVDRAELNTWEAYAHLASAADFFRRRDPAWPALTARSLTFAEEALNR